MLFPPVDPNERFRERRPAARRRKRLRRGAAVSAVLAGVALLSVGAQFVSTSGSPSEAIETATVAATPSAGARALPVEIRGVHVTMGLASLPGKLDEYLDLESDGLTALELDVKDENGRSASHRPMCRSQRRWGPRATTTPRGRLRGFAHERDIYLIGRVVVFGTRSWLGAPRPRNPVA